MTVVADTSFLMAGIVTSHAVHSRALPWMNRLRAGEFERWCVPQHALAELYAGLTRIPFQRPIPPPEAAWRVIEEQLLPFAQIVPLAPADYQKVIRRLAAAGLPGGVVYDGLIAQTAINTGAELLLTFNPSHFRRVWPEGGERIREP